MSEFDMRAAVEPVHRDRGDYRGSYGVFRVKPDKAEQVLRESFREGPDEFNIVLFSTSGVHGSYCTLEDAERSLEHFGDRVNDVDWETELKFSRPEVTFVILRPRTITTLYGNVRVTRENLEWLKRLRAQSKEVFKGIG